MPGIHFSLSSAHLDTLSLSLNISLKYLKKKIRRLWKRTFIAVSHTSFSYSSAFLAVSISQSMALFLFHSYSLSFSPAKSVKRHKSSTHSMCLFFNTSKYYFHCNAYCITSHKFREERTQANKAAQAKQRRNESEWLIHIQTRAASNRNTIQKDDIINHTNIKYTRMNEI